MKATVNFFGQRWFQVFGVGLVLFFSAEQALKFTSNLNLIPTVILLGAFVIPVAFVAYFFSAEHSMDRFTHKEVSLPLVIVSFFIGGAIGVMAAGIVEYETLKTLSVASLFGVAAIEETAKLIVPVAIFIYSTYRSRADGLLFGVASGMGFAALETMGYGLVALIQSQGNVGVLEEVLLIRGMLSPVGHAAWTGIVCAVLWGSREKTGKSFSYNVALAFVLAIVLHALWDIAGTSSNTAVTYVSYVIIGAVSLFVLIMQLIRARRSSLGLRASGGVS